MTRLLSDQQYSLATLLAKEMEYAVASRLDALERVALGADQAMRGGETAMQAHIEARPLLHALFNGGLVVYNADALAVASYPVGHARAGTYLRDAVLIEQAIGRGHATIGKAYLGDRFDAPSFSMAAPIRDEHGGVLGIIVGEIELGLRNFMTEAMTTPFGKSGGFLLIDRDERQIIMATDKRRVMEKLPGPGVNPLIDRFLAGYEGTAVLVNPLGEEVLVADRVIRSAGWIISVTTPTREAFAPITAMKQHLLGATALLSLLAAVLAWWFLRRQFRPLESSLHHLAAMRQPGQPLVPLPVGRPDEIGQFIAGFNSLIEGIEAREASLRDNDACLRSILTTSLDGFWKVSREGYLLDANETYARMSGYPVDELIGMHVSALLAEASAAEAAQRQQQIIETGHLQFEDVHRRKDGSLWPIEASATFQPQGGGQVVAFIRDITGRKRNEAALREAERKFTALVEQSLVGVYMIRGGEWLYINPQMARMFGYASAEECIASTRVGDLVAPESRALVAENLRRRLSGEIARISYGFTGLRKDGGRIEVEVFGSTLEYDGQPAVLGLVVDVTERKRAEAELERHRLQLEELVLERTHELAEARDRAESANRAKSAFLSSMSHELRTPLNHIAGFAALLARDVETPRGKERLDKLRASTDMLLGMINDILDYSRLEADQLAIETVDFELVSLLRQVEQAHRAVAVSKGLILQHAVAAGVPGIVRGDPVRLAQVLGHLLGNAVKFSERGCITVRVDIAETVPPMLRFAVEDQGIGIPADRHGSLFQLFNQIDASSTRRFGGTGLGLQLCKRLAERMAGTIGFSSVEGQGSVFWFTVPLLSRESRQPPATVLPMASDQPAIDLDGLLAQLEVGDLEAKAAWERDPGALSAILGPNGLAFGEAMAGYDFETARQLLLAAVQAARPAG